MKLLSGILLLFISFCAPESFGHTLPISYLTVVSDRDYIHLELTLNPFELSFISEFDENKDRLLDSAELQVADKVLAQRILQHIKLKADGREIPNELSGFSESPGDHHVTLRAHYRCGSSATVAVESDLTSITSASHLMEVTFFKGGARQLARLDSQTKNALFTVETKHSETPVPTGQAQASTGFVVVLLLGAIPSIAVFITLLLFAPKQLREQPAEH